MQELRTTRGANDALTTTTPGVAPLDSGGEFGLGGGELGQLFSALIKKRLTAAMGASPQFSSPGSGQAVSAAPAPSYMPPYREAPALGQAPIGPKTMSRQVIDPNQSPYFKFEHPGFPDRYVTERFMPNGKWEFEDLRPQGASGGISGGGAESMLHADSGMYRPPTPPRKG